MSRSIARCSVAQRHVNCRRTWLFVSFCRTARARARQVKRSGKASEQISSSSSSSSSSSVFVKFVHFATREQEKQPFIYSFQGFCSERREREEKRSHEDEARKRASETAAAAAAARRKEAREGSRRTKNEDDECRCSLEETRFDEPQRTEVPLFTNLARE